MNLQRRTKSVTFGHCAGLSPVACAEPSRSKGEPKGVRHTPDSYRGSAKEKDTEIERSEDSQTPLKDKREREQTGYSYFGARYYDSDLSVWLSVDPLADKYPSMTSYMYTAGNPVMLVDPDGRKITNPLNKVLSNRTLRRQMRQFDKAVSRISGLPSSSFNFVISGGDRYRKDGKIYSASNHKQIKNSAKNSPHLQENGAIGVDLLFADGIDYSVIAQAAKEVGMRLDPSGPYTDGHFHLDIKGMNEEMEYDASDYRPVDADFIEAAACATLKNETAHENNSTDNFKNNSVINTNGQTSNIMNSLKSSISNIKFEIKQKYNDFENWLESGYGNY